MMIAFTSKTFQRFQSHKNFTFYAFGLAHQRRRKNMHMDTNIHQNKKNKSIYLELGLLTLSIVYTIYMYLDRYRLQGGGHLCDIKVKLNSTFLRSYMYYVYEHLVQKGALPKQRNFAQKERDK